jgi:4-hydroxy 2-oxovalerate aldolase
MQILDCTLRDGGYYTNWDFDDKLVDTYLDSINNLPIDFIEVGYRSPELKDGYKGKYHYLPIKVLQKIKEKSNKKIVVILDEKNVQVSDVNPLLEPCIGLVDMVRIAINPERLDSAILLAKSIKALGFSVGFNVMYMSKWKDQPDFLNKLPKIEGLVDFFYMVDSYGGVTPTNVRDIFNLVRSKIPTPIGFHGHNNLEMALINTLTAIECGATIIDSTITGMGRGAGNLKTELLLTYLQSKGTFDFNYNYLSKVVDAFVELQKEYDWGTNLPYMVSGANSLPQKDVMDWMGKRYYSVNSIIRALENQSKGVSDNLKLATFNLNELEQQTNVLVVGGGFSVMQHSEAILDYLKNNPNCTIIHASSKNSSLFSEITNKQLFCLVGNEGYRLESKVQDSKNTVICVLPPYPRKMGTYIPTQFLNNSYELEAIDFAAKFKDSHTAIALQLAKQITKGEILLVGYDGYTYQISEREQELFYENEYLFEELQKSNLVLKSLTPTSYKNLISETVYSKL